MGTARAHDMGKRGTEGWDGGARETGKRKGAVEKNNRGQEESEGAQADRVREEWQMERKGGETGRTGKGNHVKRGRIMRKQKQK